MTSVFDELAGLFVDTLGQTVGHRPAGMSPLRVSRQVCGIFVARASEGLDIVQPGPALHVAAEAAADIASGDMIEVSGPAGGKFIVGSREPDGKGMVRLELKAP